MVQTLCLEHLYCRTGAQLTCTVEPGLSRAGGVEFVVIQTTVTYHQSYLCIVKLLITDLDNAMSKPTINDARPPSALVCVFTLLPN